MLPFLAVLAALAPALAQADPSGEGPLNNDSFQPTNLTAEELFHGALSDFAAGQTDAAFEGLRAALAISEPGDAVRLPSAGPADKLTLRTTLGIEAAADWFLNGLEQSESQAWTQRFEELAGLDSEANPERQFPVTNAAFHDALVRADHAFDAGHMTAATTWLERAKAHLARLSAVPNPAAEAALSRRESAAANWLETSSGPRVSHQLPATWDTLSKLPRPSAVAFEFALADEDPYLADLIGNTSRNARLRTPGSGLRPGLVATQDDRVAIQTAGAVHIIDLAKSERILVFEPAKLLESRLGRLTQARAARQGGAPGWAHLPQYHDQNLLLVVGRTEPDRRPNALVSIAPQTDSEATPVVNWILSDSRVFSENGYTDPQMLEPIQGAEIQPGTVIVDDQIIFQARVLDGEVKTYLVSISLRTGTPKWLRLVTKGGDLPSAAARFSQARLPLGSAAPLIVQDGHVLVQTNLGICALYSASSGRLLWSFKSRRRNGSEPGWSGITPLLLDPTSFVVAPSDSDHSYQLTSSALVPPNRAPLIGAPQSLRFNTDQVATQDGDIIHYARPSGERQITQTARDGSRTSASILLRRDEHFAGLPATSQTRVVTSTNRGLFLFDRTRELMLLDYQPMPGGSGPRAAGGDIFALASRVLVLGPGTLWIFQTPLAQEAE